MSRKESIVYNPDWRQKTMINSKTKTPASCIQVLIYIDNMSLDFNLGYYSDGVWHIENVDWDYSLNDIYWMDLPERPCN